jgi:2-haloacid dehalogenase
MSQPTFRPTYVSFDCYGTLINFQMTPITQELVGDRGQPTSSTAS